jgi:hypothetical protein
MIVRYMAYLCAPKYIELILPECRFWVKTALRFRIFIPYLDFSIPDPDPQHCVKIEKNYKHCNYNVN